MSVTRALEQYLTDDNSRQAEGSNGRQGLPRFERSPRVCLRYDSMQGKRELRGTATDQWVCPQLERSRQPLTRSRRPSVINSPASALFPRLSPHAPPFIPSGLQIGLSYAPMSVVWPSQVGGNDVSNTPRFSTHMKYTGPMSLLSGTNDIKAASPALLQRHRQRLIPATQVKFLNSFVHMGPYHDPDADITCSSPAFNSRFSGGSTVDMICLSLKQQKHSSVIPGLITRVGEYAIPGKGGRCDQRDQELEAGFIKQFECCQLQINGMHELLDQ